MPRTPIHQDDSLTFRVPTGWREALRQEGEENERTISSQCRWIIGEHLRKRGLIPASPPKSKKSEE